MYFSNKIKILAIKQLIEITALPMGCNMYRVQVLRTVFHCELRVPRQDELTHKFAY